MAVRLQSFVLKQGESRPGRGRGPAVKLSPTTTAKRDGRQAHGPAATCDGQHRVRRRAARRDDAVLGGGRRRERRAAGGRAGGARLEPGTCEGQRHGDAGRHAHRRACRPAREPAILLASTSEANAARSTHGTVAKRHLGPAIPIVGERRTAGPHLARPAPAGDGALNARSYERSRLDTPGGREATLCATQLKTQA